MTGKVLRLIPMDGTFDQTRPLLWLLRLRQLSSFFCLLQRPLSFQEVLVQSLFN